MSEVIQLDAPDVGALEKEYLCRAIDNSFISTFGPFVGELEKEFALFIGAKRAVATQSGTSALHMALHELGIGKGHEVIVPDLTFVATVNAVLYTGATPVFADVDKDTWTIDIESMRRAITKNTRAIIPVHLYGSPCAMNEIADSAKEHSLFVIEDATESLGSRYDKGYTGTLGDLGCFSFNGNKTITTGGGGMIVGGDDTRMEHMKFLVNQARDEAKGYFHSEMGFNYRMTNLEASLGLAQMKRLPYFLERKKIFHRIYQEELGAIDGIRLQKEHSGSESIFWLTCITFEPAVNVEEIRGKLALMGIKTRRVFTPLSHMPYLKEFCRGTCDRAMEIYQRGLCLPCSTLNSEEDVRAVCARIIEIMKNSK